MARRSRCGSSSTRTGCWALLLKAHCPEFREKPEITGDGPVKIMTVRYPIRIEDPQVWSDHYRAQYEVSVKVEEEYANAHDNDRRWTSPEREQAAIALWEEEKFARLCAKNVRAAEIAARNRIV
jgi:hypothetical protein